MKRAVLIIIWLIMSFCFSLDAHAVFDPPHTEASGVACDDCHGSSLVIAGGSPFWTDNKADSAYNAVCMDRCHVSGIPPYTNTNAPPVVSHTSGGTPIKCTVCHHNHEQEQIYTGVGAANRDTFLLATGTASSAVYEGGSNTTTITYSALDATDPGSDWASDLTTLASKSGDGRGALLMPNRNNRRRSQLYMITAIDDPAPSTVIVKGDASSASDFAIIYGQLVRSEIDYVTDPVIPGMPAKVKFYDRAGANGFVSASAPYDGICQVCHTQTTHWRYDGTVSADGTHSSYTGKNCMICHDHVTELKAVCDTCHDYPPGALVQPPDDTGSLTEGAHAVHVTDKGYSCDYCHLDSYGKAPTHNNGDRKITMGFSLFDGAYQGGDYDGQNTAQYDVTTTSPATTVSNTGTKTCSDLYCHGTYPAGNDWGGGADTTPVWDDPTTAECGDCHKATAADPPTSGQHRKHARAFSNGYNYDCGFCHKDPGVDGTLHGNNKSEVIFSNDPEVSGGIYNGSNDMLGTYGTCENLYCHSTVQSSPPGSGPAFRTTPAWDGSMSGCDKCHYTYGSNPGLASGSHDPHFYNDQTQQCYACHAWEGNDDPCFSCHLDGNFYNLRQYHANYEINVIFAPQYGGSYSGSPAPGDAYGSCSNVYCHGNYDGSGLNANPTWNDPPSAACGTCHGAANDAVPASGSHEKHAGNGVKIIFGGVNTNLKNIACTVCHEDIIDGTGPDSYTIQSKAKHVNKLVDWKFDTSDARITGSESYSIASGGQSPTDGDAGAGHRDFGTCSNVYCHSNAQPDGGVGPPDIYTTPANLKWGTVLGCYGCHAGEIGAPDDSSFARTRHTQRMTNPATATGSHYKHLGSGTSEGRCELCHNWFYPSNTNMSQCGQCHQSHEGVRSLHVNGNVDILFNQYSVYPYGVLGAPYNTIANSSASYNGTPAPGDGYGTCSDIYCHTDGTSIKTGDGSYSNTTPAWGTAGWTKCNKCHGTATAEGTPEYGIPDYANGTPKVNSHQKHIDELYTVAQGDGEAVCTYCHSGITNDGTSIAGAYSHANAIYSVTVRYPPTAMQFSGSDALVNYNSSGYCSKNTCHGEGNYYADDGYSPAKSYTYWGENIGCGDCHLASSTVTDGEGDQDNYTWGDGTYSYIDNHQWEYSGHGKVSGTYDVSGNPAADFAGSANCQEYPGGGAAKPEDETRDCDPCLYCHDATVGHDKNNDSSNFFRLKDHGGANGWNDVCLVCHGSGSIGYDPDGAGPMNTVNRTTSGAVDKYHFGHLHGADNDGGSLCWDCHDPHGDRYNATGNIYMIHEKVTVDKLDAIGKPDTTVFQVGEPIFTNNQTGSDYASVNPGPYTGICNVCHAVPGNGGPDYYTWQSGSGHNIGQKCTNCHDHSIDTLKDGNAFEIHDNANAAVGNCEYCHADPRPGIPDWDAATPGDNGANYGTNVPTQLACRECHVSFSGGNLIVTKFTRADYVKYTSDYTKTTQHQIPVSVNRINNYGMCFDCHDGTNATAVTVWHARPDKHDATVWVYEDPSDSDARQCTGTREGLSAGFLLNPDPENWAQYLPGRSSGTISEFNLFQDPGFGYTPNLPAPPGDDFDPCDDWTDYTTTSLTFSRIAIPAVPGNGNTSGSVPVFPSLTPLTP